MPGWVVALTTCSCYQTLHCDQSDVTVCWERRHATGLSVKQYVVRCADCFRVKPHTICLVSHGDT